MRVGKYEVVKHIATGGMGAVYRAIDTDLGREVALKILSPELAAKPIALERFRREARSAAKLRHENIVAIYEFGEAAGTHFLALEFVDGVDLHQYISRRRRLKFWVAREIMIQAARALDHAHGQGIIHRDLKPSNFLISKKDGRLLVKMTDLGLARDVNPDEERVTRIGTTVGTVDYMSPEQARGARLADIRSDIYSLGCTLYHMLTGTCPFPDGTVIERITRHLKEEPPDVRRFNPDAPPGLLAVLRRMLAKRPEDRYQTPVELLAALQQTEGRPVEAPASQAPGALPEELNLEPLAESAAASSPSSTAARLAFKTPRSDQVIPEVQTAVPGRAGDSGRRPAKKRFRDEDDELFEKRSARRRGGPESGLPTWWPYAVGGLLLVVAIVVAFTLMGFQDETPAEIVPGAEPRKIEEGGPPREKGPLTLVKVEGPKDPFKQPVEKSPVDKAPGVKPPVKPPEEKNPPPPEGPARTRADFEGALAAFPPAPAMAVTLRVGRGLTPGPDAFRSLAEACAAAPKGGHTIIEIHDSGPLFEPSIPVVPGRSLTVRGGGGYRPLLAWEGGAGKFLAVESGSLSLENLDVVMKCAGDALDPPPVLFEAIGGDLAARHCTFSIAGKHPRGVQVVRLDGRTATVKGRLSGCYLRGAATALAVNAAAADVLIDDCLLVGGDVPLLDIAVSNGTPSTLRLVRSTLVAGKTLLRAAPAGGANGGPALKCLCWGALLSRAGNGVAGDMVHATGGAGRMGWREVGCVYAGWEKLLAAAGTEISATSPSWAAFWSTDAGSKVVPGPWPKGLPATVEEVAATAFNPKDSPVQAATAETDLPGCDLAALPTGRPSWRKLAFERFPVPAVALLGDEGAPPIPQLKNGRYHGETVVLNRQVDLGLLLRHRLQNAAPGPKIVLHLSGSGECLTSPIQVRGADLMLYFRPPVRGAKPLTLVPNPMTTAGQKALIEVEDGTLEMIGAHIVFPNKAAWAMPARVVRVRGGVKLFGCHLAGPLSDPPPTYQGLLVLEGSEKEDPAQAHVASLNQCVLMSAGNVLRVQGTGARLRLHQCAVLGPGHALQFDASLVVKRRLNVQCLLERNTIAAAHGVLDVKDTPFLAAADEPIVVQADANVFLNPFVEMPWQPALLRGQGEALARGLLLWQGRGNAYDSKRLQAYVAAEDDHAPARQEYAVWARLWGKVHEERPLLVEWPALEPWTFSFLRPQLDCLRLPPTVQAAVGADLARIGMRKMP